MKIKSLELVLFGSFLMLASSLAFGQVFTVSEESVAEGTATVDIDWTWENSNEDISSVAVDITFDEVILTAVDLDNCIINSVAEMDNCVTIGSENTILITLTKLSADDMIGVSNGTMTFTIDGSAVEGDVSSLPMEIAQGGLVPDDADVELNEGTVTITAAAADESELAVTPSSHDFGTINVGDSDSTTFTAENVGDADLDITDVSISGASQFTIANDDCGGQTLTPGDTCEVDVDFDGDAEGTYSAEITFESDADVNDEVVVEVTGEVVEDNGAEEGFTVDFDGGLGAGDAGDTVSSTGTVVYEGDTSGSLSCELSGDVFSSNPDPLDFTFAESGSEEFTISCTLPEDAEDGQDYGGALSCTDENDEVVYSGELSCSVTADEPEPTPAVPVPTMQSWGIALFSLIMLAIGGLSIRAFRS